MKDTGILKKIINIVGRLITIASIIFVCVAVYRLGFDFSVIENVPFFIMISAIGAVLIAVGVFIQGFAWKSWLDFFAHPKNRAGSEPVDSKEAVCVYAKANIGKYLPGNVMHYVERNLFAKKSGAMQLQIALSSVFEIGTQVLVAMVACLVTSGDRVFSVLDAMLGADWRRIAMLVAIVLGVLCFFAILALILLINRVSSMSEKPSGIMGKLYVLVEVFKGYSVKDILLTLMKTMALYVTVMIIGGIVMAVLYVYMGGSLSFAAAVRIISGYIIAWVLGFVVPGAPGGIGVREFVLTMVLGSIVGQELILVLMVIHRLITIIGDFLAYLVQSVLMGAKKSEEEGTI